MKDDSINIYVKKKSNISSDTAESVNFDFSHYKSMGTISCHINQSSYPTGIKTQLIKRLMPLACMQSFGFFPLMVSEKMFKHFYKN